MTYIMREGVFVCFLLIEYGLSSVWFLILQFVMCTVAQAKVVLGMGFLYSSPRFLMIKNFNFPPTPPLPQFQSNVCNRHYTAGLQSPLARALSWKLLPKRRTQQKEEKEKKMKIKEKGERGKGFPSLAPRLRGQFELAPRFRIGPSTYRAKSGIEVVQLFF